MRGLQLICEIVDDANFICETGKDGKKSYYIEGTFLQGDIKNRNGRIYPVATLESEVNRYNTEYIQKNRAYGELGHPTGPAINLDRVSHMIKELHRDGTNFYGKAKITTETPMGQIVKNLLDEGANLGVSSRGMGSLKQSTAGLEVQGDFKLATAADIVADPSAPDAFVRGIMEGVEWIYDIASGGWVTIEGQNTVDRITEEIKAMDKEIFVSPKKFLYFEKYIDAITRKN